MVVADKSQPRTERLVLNDVYDENSGGFSVNKTTQFDNQILDSTNLSYTFSTNAEIESYGISGLTSGETDTLTIEDSSGNVYFSGSVGGAIHIAIPSGFKIVLTQVSGTTGVCGVIARVI